MRRKRLDTRRPMTSEPEPATVVVDEHEGVREHETIPGDDCEAVIDDPGDELVEEVEDNDVGEEEDESRGIRVEEQTCVVLSTHIGDIAMNDGVNDDESGDDDCWKEDQIPDPISSEDDEEDARREAREDGASSDDVLVLGKTFSSADEFKQALFRYSLKTRYNIKLYISTQMRLAAVCLDTEYDCPWRVYCSYEKRKHKLQIKVYINEHACVRSGYSKC